MCLKDGLQAEDCMLSCRDYEEGQKEAETHDAGTMRVKGSPSFDSMLLICL